MKNSNKGEFLDHIDLNYLLQYKSAKIILYAGIGLLCIYSLGHFFKVSAHAIRGYNDFRNAFKN
jgi:hypothetical protein